MTQEEFYIWLLDCNPQINLNNFNPEFLKNYEIAKLLLEKFKIHNLSEIQQRNLNPEAVLAWFRVSDFINLEYDIPEILELLPERIVGNLYLQGSKIQAFPNLESVGGYLDLRWSETQSLPKLESVGEYLSLRNSEIQSLPHLKSVGWGLYLQNSQTQTLPQLESVGGLLNLENSQIQSLPELKSVGGHLNLYKSQIESLPDLEYVKHDIVVGSHKVDYWINYFYNTKRPALAEKVKIG